MKEKVCCEMCGRDTTNKCRTCRHCNGGRHKDSASSATGPWSEWLEEAEYDYSEDALGPKQAEDRLRAEWVEVDLWDYPND